MARKKKAEEKVEEKKVVETPESATGEKDEKEIKTVAPPPEPIAREPEVAGITCSAKEIKFKEDTVTIVFATSDSTQFVPFVVLSGCALILTVREAQGRFKFTEEKDGESAVPATAELSFENQQSLEETRAGLIAEVRELEEKLEVDEGINFTGDEGIEALILLRDNLRNCAEPAAPDNSDKRVE